MGQKVNPYGFRLGVTTDWKSRWFSQPRGVRRTSRHRGLEHPGLPDDRDGRTPPSAASRSSAPVTVVRVDVHTARPGIVIGRRGAQADRAPQEASPRSPATTKVQLNIQEIKQPELDAALIAQGVADQLAGRVAFRRAMKRAVQNAQKAGALGIRVQCSGRLGGSEMSAHRVVPRGSRPAAHAAGRHRLRLPRGPHDRRPHRGQGVDLQGRHPALQERHRADQKISQARRPWPSARPSGHRRPPASRSCRPSAPQGRTESRRGGGRPRHPPRQRTRSSRRRHRWCKEADEALEKPARSRRGEPRALLPRDSSETPHFRPGRGLREIDHADAQEGPAPQDTSAAGSTDSRQGRHRGQLRRLRHPGARARLDHRSSDRGGPRRHDPSRIKPWRQGVDQHLPRQADHRRSRPRPAWAPARATPRCWVAVVKPGRIMFELVGVHDPETRPRAPSSGRSRSCRSRRASSPVREEAL